MRQGNGASRALVASARAAYHREFSISDTVIPLRRALIYNCEHLKSQESNLDVTWSVDFVHVLSTYCCVCSVPYVLRYT